MKKKLLLAIFALILTAGVFAQTEADFNVELTDDGEGVRIKGYTGKEMAVKIPAEIEGIPVREIGKRAFQNGDYGRGGPSITSVTFPEGLVKIGTEAFKGCGSLTTVVIPDSVTVIGYGAFENCYYTEYTNRGEIKKGLTSVTLPRNLTILEAIEESYSNPGVFQGCELLASVKFTGTSLTEIPTHTFAGTALTTIAIPEGVTKIGIHRKYGNVGPGVFPSSLTTVTLPSTLVEIGEGAFSRTKLKTLIIPDSVTTIENNAFANCTELTSVTLGVGIKYINSSAFENCSSLATFTIPDSVTAVKSCYWSYDVFHEGDFSSGFEGCVKLGIAAQAAIKRRGYTGSFSSRGER